MLKKTLIQTQFGTPHAWTRQYFENFRMLESQGWDLIVFTPNPLPAGGNIRVVKMTVEEYDGLMFAKVGVRAGNHLKNGVPAKLISDHYCAHGQIFEDYLQDADYWWISNWDCTYGRLSKFLPDSELMKFDVWADEGCVAINGIFTLFRNNARINNLFRLVPDWETSFTLHKPCAFDEIQMTECVRKLAAAGEILFGHPEHFPFHTHDRLPMHQPEMNLYFESDGALIERYDVHAHPPARVPYYGREVMLAHWQRTKRWPIQ